MPPASPIPVPPRVDPRQEAIDQAVASFQAGRSREESFRFLFQAYYGRIRSFFARRTSSVEDCLDLTQETFLRVYRGLESFRGEAPFGAWLYRIARNVIGDDHRRRRARGLEGEVRYGLAPPDGLRTEAAGFDAIVDRDEKRALREEIESLPEQRRKCIVLWAYHELSYEQIAVVLGLALGTVKAHLAQAKEQLTRRIETRKAAQNDHL